MQSLAVFCFHLVSQLQESKSLSSFHFYTALCTARTPSKISPNQNTLKLGVFPRTGYVSVEERMTPVSYLTEQ